ncbi:hypothetical protein EXIGLDRAFT_601406 [Exidia glandulosa HHB12029]|uniref:Uncharacterized protein n=1 Tax=Exidia glandulosa HHB12029 TaxID=1314781 RepID=A0A165PY03_EXIGL|nr:hypothetical protein EXIGLDRAFT_601406 [Exidia glandulosa HHB12029]
MSDTSESWLPFIVAQYHLEGHHRRTEHWSLAALSSRSRAHIFEVVGTDATFNYAPRLDTDFARNPLFRGGCIVGHVRASGIAQLTELLRAVRVVRYALDWDCQNWVMDALRLLRDMDLDDAEALGFRLVSTSERAMRDELGAEKERWEVADDTIEERLFPASA